MASVVTSQVHLGADTQRRMTRLAALRVERTRLEAAFHMRPDRATAMRLAAIYGELSQQLVDIFEPTSPPTRRPQMSPDQAIIDAVHSAAHHARQAVVALERRGGPSQESRDQLAACRMELDDAVAALRGGVVDRVGIFR